jgi:hypothetical protein
MIDAPVKTGQGEGAYGFGLLIDQLDGLRRIWHTGGIQGFNSVLSWLPDIGLRTAVISNGEALPSDVVEEQIIAALTSDEPLPPLRDTPQPGAEAALRKLITSEAAGEPDYSIMSPPLAAAVRAQLPQIRPLFERLGPIRSITFERVDLGGIDSYRVDFANGAVICTIALLPDGRIALTNLRPVKPAGAR